MKSDFVAFRVQITGPSVDPLIAWIQQLGPTGSVLLDATRRALVLGVLRNIRRRFLARMGLAQQVYIDNSKNKSLRDRRQDAALQRKKQINAKQRLNAAYEKLDKAMLQGDQVRARNARSNLERKANDVVFSTLGAHNVGRKAGGLAFERAVRQLSAQQMEEARTGSDARLGLLVNGLMKYRQLMVLEQLTSASEIFEDRTGHSVMLSTGRAKRLEDILTPSVAEVTSGRHSPSPKRTLWRQLEFGAGSLRVHEQMNPAARTDYARGGRGWFFGPLSRSFYKAESEKDMVRPGDLASRGLKIRGIKPMKFLFDTNGAAFKEDAEAALKYFDEAMRASAPQF